MEYFFRSDNGVSGRFAKTVSRRKIGDISAMHDCILLAESGDFISFVCPQHVKDECALEIIELHQKTDAPFCYELFSGGKSILYRTMEPLSDSLCPFFAKLTFSPGDEIRIVNKTDAPVRFVSVCLHTDLSEIIRESLSPMEIGFCFPRPSYTDYASDLAVFKRIRDDFQSLRNFTPAVGIEIPYMLLSDKDISHRLSYAMRLSKDSSVPLIFNFNTWWDGTPSCRDGLGGYFSDAAYQQVVYDPLSGDTRLSIPNIWRNTPWYTMNHENLNNARKERLARVLFLLNKTAALSDYVLPLRILIDNEPTYWAEFAYSQSPEAGGDFSAEAIKAAKKDGVDLMPSGAVTPEQKSWLLGNHSLYISDLSKKYHDCLKSEIAVLTENGLRYTDNALSENTLTHIIPNSGYPYADDKHPMYEQHVTKWARLGLECAGFQDERILSYASATGRFAQVNAERCCYTDPRFHLQFYAHGAFTDIIFNYFYDTDIGHLKELDTLVTLPMPPVAYGRTVASFHAYEDRLGSIKVHACQNLAVCPLRERHTLRPEILGKGSLTMKVGNTGDYPMGGHIEIKGLIRPQNGSVVLYMGHTPDCSDFTEVLPEHDADFQHLPLRIPLAPLLETPGELWLRLEIESNYYDDWAQMNSVWSVRAVAALHEGVPNASGLSLNELRALSLNLALRTDINRLSEMNPSLIINAKASSESAQKTYKRIMHAVSEAQTRSFLIRATGKIERFGIEILAFGGDPILTFPSDDPESAYITGGKNAFARLKHEKGESLLTPSGEKTPESFTGTFVSFDAQTAAIRVRTHKLAAFARQPYIDFPCIPDVSVVIRPSEITGNLLDHITTNPYTPAAIVNARIDAHPTLSSLKTGDFVTLRIKDGIVSSVQAVRGLARGKLVSFSPMTLLPQAQNPRLILETAPGRTYSFELGSETHLNYVKAPAENAMLAGPVDLRLDIGSILLISFESEAFGDRPLRALEITLV